MADDEIVPEGISDFLPHESHGDLSSFDVDEAYRAMRSRTDQLMADRGLRTHKPNIQLWRDRKTNNSFLHPCRIYSRRVKKQPPSLSKTCENGVWKI